MARMYIPSFEKGPVQECMDCCKICITTLPSKRILLNAAEITEHKYRGLVLMEEIIEIAERCEGLSSRNPQTHHYVS